MSLFKLFKGTLKRNASGAIGKGSLPFDSHAKKGFIRTLIIIVIGILILSYFGFNIREIAESDTSRENFTYVQEIMVTFWERFLEKPVMFIWNQIIIDIIWDPLYKILSERSKV